MRALNTGASSRATIEKSVFSQAINFYSALKMRAIIGIRTEQFLNDIVSAVVLAPVRTLPYLSFRLLEKVGLRSRVPFHAGLTVVLIPQEYIYIVSSLLKL